MRRERIGMAQNSQDLGEVGLDDVGDIDIIRAMGMIAQTHSLGISLWRLRYSGAMRELGTVLAGLSSLATLNGRDPQAVVPVLQHWLRDVCPACKGRGYPMLTAGAPVLSDDPCSACDGSGRRALDLGADATWLLEQIASAERVAAAAVMRKLANDMDELGG